MREAEFDLDRLHAIFTLTNIEECLSGFALLNSFDVLKFPYGANGENGLGE
jgi:hypothetical protein